MDKDLISRKAVLSLRRNTTRNFFGEIVEESIDVADIEALPSVQPEHTETHSCDYQHTETHDSRREWYMKGYRTALRLIRTSEEFEWCHDCKEYDKEAHCCHRWNKVIGKTVTELEQAHGWIPVTDRLPEDIRPVIVTWKNNDPESYYQSIVGKHFIGVAHFKGGKWYWYSSTTEDFLAEYGRYDGEEFDEAIEVIAWCEMPEPYTDFPTIEPQRMRGKWIPTEPDEPCFYMCSLCRRLNDDTDNFCPNCGADMRGEQDGNT